MTLIVIGHRVRPAAAMNMYIDAKMEDVLVLLVILDYYVEMGGRVGRGRDDRGRLR